MDGAASLASRNAPKQIADLDGPRGWPLLGNSLQLELSQLHQQLEGWAKIYGPLYRLRIGPRNVLVVARSDLIAGILRDRPDGWSRLLTMQAVIREMGIDGVFAAEGEAWRRQRRLVAAAFTPGLLKRYFPLIERVTRRLKEQLDAAAHAGAWIDLQAMLMQYSVDVTASLAFGIDVNTMQQPDGTLQEHLNQVLPMIMRRMNAPVPLWRYIKLPADRAFDRHLAAGHAAVQSFIRVARDRLAANPELAERPTNLLEAMLAARDADGGTLSEAEVAGNVFTMLLAGEDTTANTLAWTLYLLHTHPATWQAVIAEVDASLQADAMPRSVQVAAGLTLVEHCANEAMRLRPVGPLAYLENNVSTELDGVALPAGTFVLGVVRSGAVDTGITANAAEFQPSRWQAAAAGQPGASAEDQRLIAASIPFGAGPRICPGRYLAILEMKMVLATIARNYQLIEVGTEDGVPPREHLAFTMSPVGLRMKIRARAN